MGQRLACKQEKHAGLKLISLRLTSQNFPCKHAFSYDFMDHLIIIKLRTLAFC